MRGGDDYGLFYKENLDSNRHICFFCSYIYNLVPDDFYA